MKRFVLTCLFSAAALCASAAPAVQMNESVLPCDGGLFISNYGTETPAPAPGKGYILREEGGRLSVFLPPQPALHAPTGMAVYGDWFFAANQTNVLAWDRRNLSRAPRIIAFAPDDTAVNDLVVSGSTLYISVTNTDRIYAVDLDGTDWTPRLWLRAPGPNGLAVHGRTMYLVSSPHDYARPGKENVVYAVDDITRPALRPLNATPGIYDGAAVSADGRTVYASDWTSASVIAIDAATGRETTFYHEDGLAPADIAADDTSLYIPDMLHSRVLAIDLATGAARVIA